MKRLRATVSIIATIVLTGAAASTAGASPASAQTGTGSLAGAIAGRVTAPAGGPAAGIVVTVTDRNTASAWDTTTAANGTYSVSLPPGSAYEVAFTNGELTQFSRRTLDPSEARLYTVTSGRTTRVNERLLAPAVLAGRLVDQSGTPVAGAEVVVAFIATAGEARTTTGPDGRYRFEALPPGEVTVGFRTPDGRQQWAYQKTSPAEADLITLSLGTVTTVDDMLLPLTAAALALSWAGAASVEV